MSHPLTQIPITLIDKETGEEDGPYFLTEHQAKMAEIIGDAFRQGEPFPMLKKDKP